MKRLFSIMITFSLLLGICVPATYAITPELQTEQYSTNELAQIEEEREALYDLIRVQLEAQDAEKYFETFRYLADNAIESKYFSNIATTRAETKVYAPNGGWTYCENSQIEMYTIYFNKKDTLALYNNKNSSLLEESMKNIVSSIMWDFIENLLGFPHLGDLATISNAITSYLQWDMIWSTTSCAEYTTTYDKMDSKNIYLLMPWYNALYFTVPSSSNYRVVDYGKG